MIDYVHNTMKWLSHNRYTALGSIVAASSLFLASCQFTSKDPLTGEQATKEVLIANAEATATSSIAKYNKLEADFKAQLAAMQEADARTIAKYEAAVADIERQQQTWTSVLAWVKSVPGVGENPLLGGALGLAGAVFGLGVGVDNRRKDKVIKTAKAVKMA